jgi:CHAT domain-containing protein
MMRPFVFALALIASLSGGVAVAQTPSSGLPLGKDLGGEACRAGDDPGAARPTEIYCGEAVQSVGRLEVRALDASLPKEMSVRRQAIAEHAKSLTATLAIHEQLSCDAGQFMGSSDAFLYLCTMQSTGWPRIVLISGAERSVVQAEGMPSMLPVLAAAISAASGHLVNNADVLEGQKLLATRLPANVLTAATTDFARYSQSIEMARIYGSRNDFAAAEAALRGALEINTKMFGADSMPVGQALMELAVQVSNQGRFDEAAGLFRRASPIIEASVNADARAQLNSYLALDAANQRDFAKALAYARQATAERRAQLKAASIGGDAGSGFSGLPAASSGELAHSLRIEAEMALRLDDLPNAQAAAEEALWIVNLEPGLALWWRADVLSLIAEVNERRGRTSAAERNYLDAIGLRQKMFGESAPLVQSHLRIGRFYADQELYPQALEHFRTAMAILSRNPVARARIVPDQIVPFIAAAAAEAPGPVQRAMLDAEIFRATQLINSDIADQAIARASVRLAAANPALASLVRDAQETQRTRDQLRINIAAELAKPNDERNAVLETQLAQSLTQASTRADDLTARVQERFPEYAHLTNPQAVELADLRAQLQPGQAFLSYVIGVRGSYGLLVTSDGLTAKRLDVTSNSLSADIALLRRAFVPQLGELPEFSLRNAYTLYTELLGPFADRLKGIDHLVVAPGPVLANLPFSLLVSASPSENTGYADAQWLARHMAISQVPSARAYVSLRQAGRMRQAPPRPFLGLGDPLLTGSTGSGGTAALEALAVSCRENSPVAPALLSGLAPLPDTAEEVRTVANALGGGPDSILLGAAASESALRAHPLDQYRVLYFATHGLLPGELHCQAEPGLVLSPPATAARNTEEDGLLEAGEVATLRLNADLVVLSACNTAAAGGGRFGGGALEGLADAFFNAGARAVLASHWEVPSAATARLMTGVFQRFGRDGNHGLAEALRQSQLELIGDPKTAHPFYWAAFTLIGVGDAAGGGGMAQTAQQVNGGTL